MKKTKKRSFGVCAKSALLCALVLLFCTSCANFNEYKRRVADIQIHLNDFTDVPDGIYHGEYDAIMVSARVKVTMTDGVAKPIELIEHKNDRGKAAEAIVPLIVQKQTLLVDAITGATNSSQVIKKAIQNALESEPK